MLKLIVLCKLLSIKHSIVFLSSLVHWLDPNFTNSPRGEATVRAQPLAIVLHTADKQMPGTGQLSRAHARANYPVRQSAPRYAMSIIKSVKSASARACLSFDVAVSDRSALIMSVAQPKQCSHELFPMAVRLDCRPSATIRTHTTHTHRLNTGPHAATKAMRKCS